MPFVAGCVLWPGDDETACDESQFARELQVLRAEIETEIGEAEASSIEACRALPLGAKACGGPAFYLVYSAEVSDAERLDALAAEHRRTDEARNRACGLVSDCAITPEPTPVLDDGRCVAGR